MKTASVQSHLWSQLAQEQFQAVTNAQPAIADKLAQWVCFGEQSNRDLPLLKLSAFLVMYGRAQRATVANASPQAFDVLVHSPSQIWARFDMWAKNDTHVLIKHGSLVKWSPPDWDGAMIVTKSAVPVLATLFEFLVMIEFDDDLGFAGKWMDACEALVKAEQSDLLQQAIKAAVKLASGAMYQYRKQHLNLYGAANAYKSLANFLTQKGYAAYRAVSDDDLLGFWESSGPDEFRDFATVMTAFMALCADQASRVDASKLANAQSSIRQEDGLEAALLDRVSTEQVALLPSQSIGEQYQTSLDSVNHNLLPLVPKGDLHALSLWFRFETLWVTHMRSVVRVVAFSPVANGLTAMQQTGKSKLSLNERLACAEAVPYPDLHESMEGLSAKIADGVVELTSILAPTHLSVTKQDVQTRAQARQRSRAKGYSGGEAAIFQRAEEVWPDFLSLQEAVTRVLRAQKPLGLPSSSQEFSIDLARFAAKFTNLHRT